MPTKNRAPASFITGEAAATTQRNQHRERPADPIRREYTVRSQIAPNGIRLTLINDHRESVPLFAVVLAADFGAIHYVAQSPWGEPIQFSEGVAHLAEHLLVSHHLKGAIETLHCEFLGRFNAPVDRARSLFWVAGRARSSTEVLAAVKIILDVVLQEIDVTSLGALLSYCQREVKNEILYRTKPDFKLTESLWHGLFPTRPTRSKRHRNLRFDRQH